MLLALVGQETAYNPITLIEESNGAQDRNLRLLLELLRLVTGPNAIQLVEQSGLARSTVNMYCGVIRNYLSTGAELTNPQALARFASTLTESMRRTFRAAIGCWARLAIPKIRGNVPFELATADGMAKVNWILMRLEDLPTAIPAKPQRGQRAHIWLTPAQVQAIINSCGDDLRGRRNAALLGLLIYCGLRRSEVLNLQWSHIIKQPYRGKAVPVLNVIGGKGNRDRSIPLPPDIEALLDGWADAISGRQGYVVRAIQGHIIKPRASREIPTRVVREHGEAIGVPNLCPHDCRRTFAQTLWEKTHDLLVVQELLGHSSVETTRQYLHVGQERRIEAMRSISW